MKIEELLEKIQQLFLTEREYNQKQLEGTEKRLTDKIQDTEKRLTDKIDTVDMKVEVVNRRVFTLEGVVKLIDKKLNQSINDNASFFNETWAFLDKLKKQFIKRFELIEKYLNLPHPQEN